jgi:DNA-directed RNA polymerase specialized sigma24 family protein
MVERVYAAGLKHATKVRVADPAIEPEDLVQGAYLKVGALLDESRPWWEQAAFLRRAIDQIAFVANRRWHLHPRETLRDVHRCPGDTAARAITAVLLADALATPRPGLAEVALLGVGYSIAEIGALRGLSPTAVKSRIHRGRQATREHDV